MPLRASVEDIGGGRYTILHIGERGVAGVMGPPSGMPEGMPAFWDLSFSVADADATVAKAQELGGEVRLAPMDMPGIGRIAGSPTPRARGSALRR